MIDGVLGVPTSLRDLRTLDMGVFTNCSVISLLLLGVGGHFRTPNSSLFFIRLPDSPHVPNRNCKSGTHTCWPIVNFHIYSINCMFTVQTDHFSKTNKTKGYFYSFHKLVTD